MKKIILLLILLSMPFRVCAQDYYTNVHVQAYIGEDVDSNDVNNVVVVFDDATKKTFDFCVYNYNNYAADLKDVALGDIDFSMAMVGADYVGKYEVKSTIDKVSEKELNITLIVKKRNIVRPQTTVKFDDYISQAQGATNPAEVPITSEQPTTSQTSTNQEENDKENTINQSTRDKIYQIMFIIIGIIGGVIVIIITVKIINANK